MNPKLVISDYFDNLVRQIDIFVETALRYIDNKPYVVNSPQHLNEDRSILERILLTRHLIKSTSVATDSNNHNDNIDDY